MNKYNYRQKTWGADNWLIIDIETVGRTDVSHLLKAPETNKTLKDAVKIAADIAAKTAERDSKLALDMNTSNIVAIGLMCEAWETPSVLIPEKENMETIMSFVWEHVAPLNFARSRKVVGFNVRSFDIPHLIQTTRRLHMPEPALDYGRYSKEIIDLKEIADCGSGYGDTVCISRSLKNYCSLFGIEQCEDDCDGKDIAQMVADGRLDEVEKHCAADVLRTRDLAVRLGVIG